MSLKKGIGIAILSLILSAQGCNTKDELNAKNIIEWLEGEDYFTPDQVRGWFRENPNPIIIEDTVYFLFEGAVSEVSLAGDFNNHSPEKDPFSKTKQQNWWVKKKQFDSASRLEYKIVTNGKNWILDPLNNRSMPNSFGGMSVLEMPGYIHPWEIDAPPIESKFNLEKHLVRSPELDTTFEVTILSPKIASQNSEIDFPTVYFQDGRDYLEYGLADRALSHLIDSGTIPPIIAVFVTPYDRVDLYTKENRFKYAQFFSSTLVEYVDGKYPSRRDPTERVVLGDSYGGNISAFTSYYFPAVFKNCAMHSPAFIANEFEVYKLYKEQEKKNIKLSLVWGSYEELGSINTNLQDYVVALKERGYDFNYKVYPEGHSFGFWRATYDDLLIPLLKKEVDKNS